MENHQGLQSGRNRRAEFKSKEDQVDYDAANLINITKWQFEKTGVLADPIIFARRADDDLEALRAAINKAQNKAQKTVMPVQTSRQTQPQFSAEQLKAILTTTLSIFESRFNSEKSQKRHKGIEWTRVRAALIADPGALFRIYAMEIKGHEPDVYFADDKGFDVGTCCAESPLSGRNCVYDEEAAKWLLTNRPKETFNSNAVAMAKQLGINIMTPGQYMELQRNDEFDLESQSLLATDADTRRTNNAISGSRAGMSTAYTGKRLAYDHTSSRSWRGSQRINWTI